MKEKLDGAIEALKEALTILENMRVEIPTPVSAVAQEALQARADYNRDNAATLYSDKLEYCAMHAAGHFAWVERASGLPVTFTAYGWVALPWDEWEKL